LLKDKLEKQSKVDEEKLANVKKSMNLLSMKTATPLGRLKQLYEICGSAARRRNERRRGHV
jgi:hypothetical protein